MFMRSSSRRLHAASCAALLCAALVAGACGNRLPKEQLYGAVGEAGGSGGDVGLDTSAQTEPGEALEAAPGLDEPTGSELPLPSEGVGASAPGSTGTVTTPSAGTGRSPGLAAAQPGPAKAGSAAASAAPTAAGARPSPAAGGGTANEPKGAPAPAAGGQGPGSPATGAPAPAPGVPGAGPRECKAQGPELVLGTVGIQSGPLGNTLGSGTKGVQAWARAMNAKGGLNCQPVRYIVTDDANDPARHQALVRDLVERQGVIAMVYFNALLTGQSSEEYLKQKGIPVIGQEGGQWFYEESPVHFNQASSGAKLFEMMVAGASQELVPKGMKKAAILTCQEVQVCTIAEDVFKKGLPNAGFEIVSEGKVTLTQPDYTAACLNAQSAGADVLMPVVDQASHKRIAQSCAKVGFKPQIIFVSVEMAPDMVDEPALDGAIVTVSSRPFFLTDTPGNVEYNQVMKQFAPGVPTDTPSHLGFASAKLLERAVTNLPPAGQLTSKDILAGMYTVKDDDLGGLTYKLSFTEGQPDPAPVCGWIVVIKKGSLASDGKMFCGAA
jgi:branched-chain amino acid transport system substrate-binding protein